MNAHQWIESFSARLGTEPPTDDEFSTLLDLAGPVSCWVTARAGVSPNEALAAAREVSADG